MEVLSKEYVVKKNEAEKKYEELKSKYGELINYQQKVVIPLEKEIEEKRKAIGLNLQDGSIKPYFDLIKVRGQIGDEIVARRQVLWIK